MLAREGKMRTVERVTSGVSVRVKVIIGKCYPVEI